MTTRLGQINKPEAEKYKKGRKLYLVPLFLPLRDNPSDFEEVLQRYWSGAEEHIARLEAALGPVNRLYHESVFLSGEEGAKMVEKINPAGYSIFGSRFQKGARLEAVEDRALVEETSDWQWCLSVPLVSQKVSNTVIQGYREVTSQRYQYIADQVESTLKGDDSGILVIGQDHRVQFPSDIHVFYVAPPALNDLQNWINERLSRAGQPPEQEGEEQEPEEESASAQPPGTEASGEGAGSEVS